MEKDKNLRRRRWILAVILSLPSALLIAALLYLSFVPIDLSDYRSNIESMIEARVSGDVGFEGIVIKFLPSPDIRLKGVSASNEGKPLLKAGSLRVRLSLMPLFTGKLVLEALEISNAKAFIERDEGGMTNLRKFLRIEEVKEPKAKKKIKLAIKSFNIDGSSISLTDKRPATPAVFEVTGIKGYLYEKPDGFTYKVDGLLLPSSGLSFAGKKEKGTIKGTALLNAFQLERLNPYIRKAAKDSSVAIMGRADLNLSYNFDEKKLIEGKVVYKGLKAGYPRLFDTPIESGSGSASLNIIADDKGTEFRARDVRLLLGNFILNGAASVTGPKENRVVKVLASTTPIGLGSLKGLLPMKAIPKKAAARIEGIVPLGGTIKVDSFSLSADMDTLKRGRLLNKPGAVSLALTLNGLSFRHNGFKEPFSGITGKASLGNDELRVSEFSGRYNKELIQELKGSLSDLTGGLSYNFSLKGVFDANESLGLAKEMTRDMEGGFMEDLRKADAEGRVELEANVKGAVRGKNPLEYSGNAIVRDGALSYGPLPVRLTAINGEAGFDNLKIDIRSLSASDGYSDVRLNGTVSDYRGKDPSFELNAEGALSGETVRGIIKDQPVSPISNDLAFEGYVLFNASVSGHAGSFSSDVSLNAAPAHIKYKEFVRKEQDYPLTIDGSIALEGRELSIKKASASFGSSSLSLSGRINTETSAYILSVSSPKMRLSDLDDVSPFFATDFPSDGLVSFDISASKAPGAPAQYRGEVAVKDGHFKTPLIAKPVERINATARLNGDKARIDIEGLFAGDSFLAGRIDILSIADKAVSFEITSPRLIAGDIFRKKTEKEKDEEAAKKAAREKAIREKGEKPAPPVTGSGTIRALDGDAWGHKFSGLAIEVKFEGKTVRLAPITLSIDNGRVSGELTLHRGPEDLFEAEAKFSDIDLDTMISAFGAKERVLSGPLRGRIRLSGKRGARPFASGLNGQATLVSEKGRLWRFILTTKIFTILNIISIDELLKEGIPYKALSGDFSMSDGIISTSNMAFDSDSMRMSAYGRIDTVDATIDSILAVHPFVTIDKIISSIPLAGWIITGRQKSTVSFYFGIEGPLKSPDIDPVPTKSIKESVFGILERLIEAPMEFLRQEEK